MAVTRIMRLLQRQVERLNRQPVGVGVLAYSGPFGVVELHFYHDSAGVMRHIETHQPIEWPLDVAFAYEYLPKEPIQGRG